MLQSIVKPVQQASVPEADFENFKQTWKTIGFSLQPASHNEAEAALKKAYAAAGLEAPRKIVWCGSPFSLGLARMILLDPEFLNSIFKSCCKNAINASGTDFKPNVADSFRSSMRLFDTAAVKQSLFDTIKSDVMLTMRGRVTDGMKEHVRASTTEAVWNSVWKSVWDSAGDPVWRAVESGMRRAVEMRDKTFLENSVKASLQDCIGDCVKSSVWENVMDQAWGNIRNGIGSQIRVRAWEGLWKTLQTSVWENVAMKIGEQIKACGNDSAQASGYGQHDAYWLAFYAYFREAEGLVAETEPVSGLLELAKSAGWFVPHARICWVCERPSELRLDQEGRLHAAEGPALAYPDGWNLYAKAGTVVPPTTALQTV